MKITFIINISEYAESDEKDLTSSPLTYSYDDYDVMGIDTFYIEVREYRLDDTVQAICGKPIVIKHYNTTLPEFEKYCLNKTKKIVENVYNCNDYILNPTTRVGMMGYGIIKYDITLYNAEMRSLTISFIYSPML